MGAILLVGVSGYPGTEALLLLPLLACGQHCLAPVKIAFSVGRRQGQMAINAGQFEEKLRLICRGGSQAEGFLLRGAGAGAFTREL